MPRERETLADYVRRVRAEKKLSLNEVREQSGRSIATSYVNRIENGEVTDVGLEKLHALAKGLGVPDDEVFAVARGKVLTNGEAFDSTISVIFKGYDQLSDEDKAELLATVRMLAAEIERRRPKGGKKRK